MQKLVNIVIAEFEKQKILYRKNKKEVHNLSQKNLIILGLDKRILKLCKLKSNSTTEC